MASSGVAASDAVHRSCARQSLHARLRAVFIKSYGNQALPKNTIVLRGVLLALAAALSACSKEPAEPREIRAHTRVIKGVSHAEPAAKAERYCSHCHGTALQGGTAGEPSCYTCHGKTWLDASAEVIAPADHTVANQGFHHLPGLFTPSESCVACHGSSLEGRVDAGLTFPGCNLCHGPLWEERLPSAFY